MFSFRPPTLDTRWRTDRQASGTFFFVAFIFLFYLLFISRIGPRYHVHFIWWLICIWECSLKIHLAYWFDVSHRSCFYVKPPLFSRLTLFSRLIFLSLLSLPSIDARLPNHVCKFDYMTPLMGSRLASGGNVSGANVPFDGRPLPCFYLWRGAGIGNSTWWCFKCISFLTTFSTWDSILFYFSFFFFYEELEESGSGEGVRLTGI